ncbi:hypothetical protein G2W53_027624 [Senna tora]|uniref:CCHC-type domain-containing protein n=1 Tax=Senna tora TaxID=362788 RepID=A0A834WME2_9FABA|nr:hypothetical protein G2W53_027624 [Senna tora]
MAHNQALREASWSESQTTPPYSSSSSSGYSTEDSGDLEPDFIIPRQGPVIEFLTQYIDMQRNFWRNCLLGVLVDDNTIKAHRLQSIINRNEGPWAIQNKFLVMKPWQPNLILEKFSLNAVPVWVEFWGFPLEYYTASVADLVGSMVGDVLQVDFSDQGIRNLRYLRVKVELDHSLPLLMGFYVHLDDTRSIWIQCRYERMFRICKQCGCLGHVAKDCKKSRRSVQASVAAQKEALRQRFDAVTFMDLDSPLFINEAIMFRKFKGRRTTKIWVEVENDEVVYHTYEFSPIRFTRTNPSSSSSPPGSNVYRVSDGSSSDSGSSSSPPSSYHPQAEDPHAINDDMEEDSLTPEGYYSGSFGQDSQGEAASNSPHSVNIPSPINWELLATESARWQHATEGGTQAEWREETENRNRFFFGLGDELQILVQSSMPAGSHAQRVPQAQMEDNLNTTDNHHVSPLLAQLQE